MYIFGCENKTHHNQVTHYDTTQNKQSNQIPIVENRCKDQIRKGTTKYLKAVY